MTKFFSFKHLFAASILAIQLAGGASLALAAQNTPDDGRITIKWGSPHGIWQGFVRTPDNRFGASTEIAGGGTAIIIDIDNKNVSLKFTLNYCAKIGSSLPVRLSVNGKVFSGQATFVTEDSVMMDGIPEDEFNELLIGKKLTIVVDNGQQLEVVDLEGFQLAMHDGARGFY